MKLVVLLHLWVFRLATWLVGIGVKGLSKWVLVVIALLGEEFRRYAGLALSGAIIVVVGKLVLALPEMPGKRPALMFIVFMLAIWAMAVRRRSAPATTTCTGSARRSRSATCIPRSGTSRGGSTKGWPGGRGGHRWRGRGRRTVPPAPRSRPQRNGPPSGPLSGPNVTGLLGRPPTASSTGWPSWNRPIQVRERERT